MTVSFDSSKTGIGGTTASVSTVSAAWTFTVMPEVHASSGDSTPIEGRSSGDGKTVAAWNIVHNGTAGDLFHLTTGANTAGNTSLPVIAIGVDYGGTGIVIQNKSEGIGFNINQLDTITSSGAYGFIINQRSAIAPGMRLSMLAPNVNNIGSPAQPSLVFTSTSAVTGSRHFEVYDNTGGGATQITGYVAADTGLFHWMRNMEIESSAVSGSPYFRVYDSQAADGEIRLTGKNTNTSLQVYKWSGTTTLMYAYKIDASTSDRLKFQAGNGAQTKGAETFQTLIEFQCNATRRIGFFGAAPVAQQAAGTAATDLATVITLANGLRTALVNLGLAA